MDINTELFRRTAPTMKLSLVKGATVAELNMLSPASIEKMIKEAGTKIKEGHTAKILYIDREMAHNDRNSNVRSVYQGNARGTYFLDVYVQGYDTDTIISVPLGTFYKDRLVASFEEEYLTSPKTIIHAYYEPQDKARVFKAICLAYIETKYKDKLVNES